MAQTEVTVGILGGGQLGRMLALAANEWGIRRIETLQPGTDCPAGRVGVTHINGDFQDADTVARFLLDKQFATAELENVSIEGLKRGRDNGTVVWPSPEAIEIGRNKLWQKQLFRRLGIPTTDFAEITEPVDLEDFAKARDYQVVLKTKIGGFDGRGVRFNKSREQMVAFLESEQCTDWFVEEYLPFQRELALQGVRDKEGEMDIYPVVETWQKDGICNEVEGPAANLTEQQAVQMEISIGRIASDLNYVGVLALEAFVGPDGKVIANEWAPRVHNSGHPTIESCNVSQFSHHMRTGLGMPVIPIDLRAQHAMMLNFLGTNPTHAQVRALLSIPDVYVHLYDKTDRPARKVGHATILSNSRTTLYEKADQVRQIKLTA